MEAVWVILVILGVSAFVSIAVHYIKKIYHMTRSSVSYHPDVRTERRTVLFESPRFDADVMPQDIMQNNWGERDWMAAVAGGINLAWLYVRKSRAANWDEYVERRRKEMKMYSVPWLFFAANGEQIVSISRKGITIAQKGESDKRVILFEEIVQISSGDGNVLIIAVMNGTCKKALLFPMEGGNEEMTKAILAGVRRS